MKRNRQDDVAAGGEPPQKGSHGPRKKLKDRKTVGAAEFYPIVVNLLPDDLKKLAAIDEEFLCESHSRAARIALMRWHRHLMMSSQRRGSMPAKRPEFAVAVSPASGGKQKKFYCTKQDMARFDELFALTGLNGFGRQLRAAVGWLYENLD